MMSHTSLYYQILCSGGEVPHPHNNRVVAKRLRQRVLIPSYASSNLASPVIRTCGGTADALDLKFSDSNIVWVQVPLGAC